MSVWLIIAVGIVYAYIAFEQWWFAGNPWMAIVYAGYAFSNVGLAYLAAHPNIPSH